MQPGHTGTTDLGAFEVPTAEAVVSVLRRRGCPAWADPSAGHEAHVRVPAGRRDEALSLLAAHMEDVAALTGSAGAHPATGVPPATAVPRGAEPAAAEGADDGGEGPPIVLERLRRIGLGLAVLLAPLLVVTLAAPALPLRYALVVFVAGLVAVTYWRTRQGG